MFNTYRIYMIADGLSPILSPVCSTIHWYGRVLIEWPSVSSKILSAKDTWSRAGLILCVNTEVWGDRFVHTNWIRWHGRVYIGVIVYYYLSGEKESFSFFIFVRFEWSRYSVGRLAI